jgi:thiamine pyrophosphate-dependent acetolactate synthase large subunit-like protein
LIAPVTSQISLGSHVAHSCPVGQQQLSRAEQHSALDSVDSYGVPSRTVSGREELKAELIGALRHAGPRLVQVDVEPEMALA